MRILSDSSLCQRKSQGYLFDISLDLEKKTLEFGVFAVQRYILSFTVFIVSNNQVLLFPFIDPVARKSKRITRPRWLKSRCDNCSERYVFIPEFSQYLRVFIFINSRFHAAVHYGSPDTPIFCFKKTVKNVYSACVWLGGLEWWRMHTYLSEATSFQHSS